MPHQFHKTHNVRCDLTRHEFQRMGTELIARAPQMANASAAMEWGEGVLRQIHSAAKSHGDVEKLVRNFRVQAELAAAANVVLAGTERARLTADLSEAQRMERVLDTLCQSVASCVQVDGKEIDYDRTSNGFTQGGQLILKVPHLNPA